MAESNNNQKRGPLTGTKIGFVVADKSDKTRKVAVGYQFRHPKYGKTIKRSTYLQIDDPKNECKLGDQVEIVACRPISKNKSWRLVRVVRASPGPDVAHVKTAEPEVQQADA